MIALVRPLLAVVLGTLIGKADPPLEVILGLVGTGGALLLLRPRAAIGWILLLVGAAALRVAGTLHRPVAVVPDGALVAFQGRVLDRNDRLVESPWAPDERHTAAVLKVRGWIHTKSGGPIPGTFRIYWQPPPERLQTGDRVLLSSLELRHPTPRRNPGGFDAATDAWRRGIDAYLSPTEGLSRVEAVLPARGAARVREAARNALRHGLQRSVLHPTARAIVAALLFGDREEIDPDLYEAFVVSGAVHLLVVSGSNFALLLAGVFFLLRLTRLPLRGTYAVTGLLGAVYAYLVGWEPSVVRAGIFFGLYLLTRWLERDFRPLHALGLTALLVLVVRPQMLWDVGAQLSFAAAGGILYLYPRWYPRLARFVSGGGWRKGLRWTLGAALATAAAQAAVTPILIAHFFRLYWVGWVANLPAMLLSEIATLTGWLALVAGWLHPGAGRFFGGVPELGTLLLIRWIRWTASWPGAVRWVVRPGWPIGIAYGWLFGTLGARNLRDRWPQRLALTGLILAAAVAWNRALRPAPGMLEAAILDVGQGSATVIRTPDGETLLVDAGPPGAGRRVIVPFLLTRQVRRLDLLVISHGDADHRGGAPSVSQALPVRRRIDPVDLSGPRGTPLGASAPWPPRDLSRDPRVDVRILWPPPEQISAVESENDASLVVYLSYGDFQLLLPGDLEGPGESGLIALARRTGGSLQAEVLVAPHHGSRTSSTPEFLEAVRPRLILISAGARNRYGHPHRETLNRYERLGARVLRTDQHGAVLLWTDGKRVWIR